MSRPSLSIDRYMSSILVVIGPSQPLSEALRLMRLHDVRHLPVVQRGKLLSLVTMRDIHLLGTIDATAPSDILVSEAMVAKPYTVEPDERIDRVACEMARRKIGTALVTHDDRLLGLFTKTDALVALAALVQNERVPDADEERETVRAAPRRKAARRTSEPRRTARRASASRRDPERTRSRASRS